MSVFTAGEIAHLQKQGLARIATVGRGGQPHVVPVTFRYNAEHDSIDIGGIRGFAGTKKVRDVQANPQVALVVDEWQGPGRSPAIEIRGEAEVLPVGGEQIRAGFDATIIRVHPRRIISWGIEPERLARNARAMA
jgi:PPOX class F420-dependent enzyme/OxyR family protein